jgi:hypothetical protein
MAMPKASMDENRLSSRPEYNVRRARQPPIVEPVSEAQTMNHATDNQFMFRIAIPNARHALASFRFA